MDKKMKKIIVCVVCVVIIVLIIGISYVKNIRKSAMQYIKEEYSTELKNIEKNAGLKELSEDNWEDYYQFVRLQADEKVIDYQVQSNLLSFFDAYEEYSNFNILKEEYVDNKQ